MNFFIKNLGWILLLLFFFFMLFIISTQNTSPVQKWEQIWNDTLQEDNPDDLDILLEKIESSWSWNNENTIWLTKESQKKDEDKIEWGFFRKIFFRDKGNNLEGDTIILNE